MGLETPLLALCFLNFAYATVLLMAAVPWVLLFVLVAPRVNAIIPAVFCVELKKCVVIIICYYGLVEFGVFLC